MNPVFKKINKLPKEKIKENKLLPQTINNKFETDFLNNFFFVFFLL